MSASDFDAIVVDLLQPGSKKAYASQIRQFTKWLLIHYPDVVDDDDGELILPISNDIIKEYSMDYAGLNDKDDNGLVIKRRSPSSLAGFKAALKNYYTTHNNNTPLDIEISANFDKFVKRHKKDIAQDRLDGRVKSQVGKSPLSTNGNYL